MSFHKIIFLDKDDFSYLDIDKKPLAGAQTAFVQLVKAMAALGKQVIVRNYCVDEYLDAKIDWRKLTDSNVPDGDLYIVNRSTSLLPLVPKWKKIFFWLHNEGKYLLRPSNLKMLFKFYPELVFSGRYHRHSFIIWFLFRWRVIPYGISEDFIAFKKPLNRVPPPKAIFTSNPLRSLDWLIDRWTVISRSVPSAELHVFSGPTTYGTWGISVANRMIHVLNYAKEHSHFGVILREPVAKSELINEIRSSRVMLYRGDKAETFCLAVAETQVLGLPCVVEDLGSMKERVISNVTGFVVNNDIEFEQAAIKLLRDDDLWYRMHQTLVQNDFHLNWKQSANMFLS